MEGEVQVCHWEKGHGRVCVATSSCWKLALRLQNLVCRHHFNGFGHNFMSPVWGGGMCKPSCEFSSKSDLPTHLLYHMYAIPYFTVLVIFCQQFPLLRLCFPSISLFGVGVAETVAAELCEVERSSNVHFCLYRC